MGFVVLDKENWKVGMVTHTFNSGTQRAEAGEFYEFQSNLVYYGKL